MKIKIICAVLALSLSLSACGGKINLIGKSEYPFVANGVTIKSSPKSVVTLSPALTEDVYMLGYGGKLTGVSDYCDRPAISNDIPNCGTALAPYIEGIRRVGADLVLSPTPIPERDLVELQQMNINVVVVPRANSVEDILKNYEVLAKALGGLNRGQASDTQLRYYADVTLNYIFDSMRPAAKDKSAIYLRSMDFTMATGDSFEGKLLTSMGFTNPADGYSSWSYPKEKEADLNPDVIFYASDINLEKLKNSPYFKNTNAVKNNMLIEIDPTIFERQSPMMFDYIMNTMSKAFPDAFVDPRPSIIPPLPEEPQKELGFFEKLMKKFKN